MVACAKFLGRDPSTCTRTWEGGCKCKLACCEETPRQWGDHPCERKKLVCPSCGGETAVQRWLAHECSAGCDTSVRYCVECDWKASPE